MELPPSKVGASLPWRRPFRRIGNENPKLANPTEGPRTIAATRPARCKTQNESGARRNEHAINTRPPNEQHQREATRGKPGAGALFLICGMLLRRGCES